MESEQTIQDGRKHIVIIGGGITGLTAAYTLLNQASSKYRCTLIERDARLGGKIMTHRAEGAVIEAGPDSILRYKTAGLDLLADLKLTDSLVEPSRSASQVYILHRGKLEPLPAQSQLGLPTKIRPLIQSRLISLPGKVRALADLVLPTNVPEHGDVALGKFLRHRFGDELIDNIAEPLLGGIHAGSVDSLSATMTFPQLLSLHRKYGSMIRAFRKQSRVAHASHEKPAQSPFVSLRGGLEVLPNRLAELLLGQVNFELNSQVLGIHRQSDGYLIDRSLSDGRSSIYADGVIVAAPAHAAAEFLSPISSELSTRLLQIPFTSTATVLLGYDQSVWTSDLHCSGFLVPAKERRSITACTMFSDKWPNSSTNTMKMVRCFVGKSGDTSFIGKTDGELVNQVHHELAEILGIRAKPKLSKVYRWENAMPHYVPHHLANIEAIDLELARSAPGIVLAGAGYRGSGIPDCITQGKAAAKHMLDNF